MTFRLTFSEPQDVTNPGQDGVQYSFPFTIVDSTLIGAPEERSQTHEHRFIIGISRSRSVTWHLSTADIPRILFEFGRRHLISLIQSHALPADYTIRCPMITTASHTESQCPFDPSAIRSPVGLTIQVEQPKPPIGFNFKSAK
jgi:hypothetical protein